MTPNPKQWNRETAKNPPKSLKLNRGKSLEILKDGIAYRRPLAGKLSRGGSGGGGAHSPPPRDEACFSVIFYLTVSDVIP